MKNIKKLVGLALALALALSLAIPAAFAVGEDNRTGTITVKNPIPDTTYTAYRILQVVDYNADTGNYLYKVMEGWENFIASRSDDIEVDPETNVARWINTDSIGNPMGVQEFAQAALAYAKEHGIGGSSASANEDGDPVVFNAMPLGYYVVGSSAGTLCSLDTMQPNAEIEEKNGKPTIDKKIDGGEAGLLNKNSVSVGSIVDYVVTITAQPGTSQYVLHDVMSPGLTFQSDSVIVTWNGTERTVGTDYTVVTEGLDGECDFHVVFTPKFIEEIMATFSEENANEVVGSNITVTYKAQVNAAAIIEDASKNEAQLQYDTQSKTEFTDKPYTETYVYKFDLVKTDQNNVVLTGAEFELYDVAEDGAPIPLIQTAEGVYRPFIEGTDIEDEKITTIVAGNVEIQGLGNGTYYLLETKAPEGGYTPTKGRIPVTIEGADLEASVTARTTTPEDGGEAITENVWESGGVQVINKTGSLLPSTGGIGTTIFYIGGGILAVGAVILLVVRRRMRVDAE